MALRCRRRSRRRGRSTRSASGWGRSLATCRRCCRPGRGRAAGLRPQRQTSPEGEGGRHRSPGRQQAPAVERGTKSGADDPRPASPRNAATSILRLPPAATPPTQQTIAPQVRWQRGIARWVARAGQGHRAARSCRARQVRRNAPPAAPRRARHLPALAGRRDCSDEFPELAAITGALGRRRMLLDGELVCLGTDGGPDFASLRRRLRAPADKSATACRAGAAHLSRIRLAPPRRPLDARASLRAPP
jgi:hypothetical protein